MMSPSPSVLPNPRSVPAPGAASMAPPPTTRSCVRLASRLTGWTPAEPLPPGVTAADLRQALAELEEAARPASPADLVVAVGQLRRLATAFGIAVEDWTPLTQFYADGLGDLPVDLLRLAVQRVIARWSNGFRLPLPGEVRAGIAPELAEQGVCLTRLRTAEMVARRAERGR